MSNTNRQPGWFSADPFIVETTAGSLGPDGPGFTHISSVIDADHLAAIQAEIHNPKNVAWRNNRTTHRNQRGVTIYQNYDAFSLKLRHGNQQVVAKVPTVHELVRSVENLIRFDLAQYYPVLTEWHADEMVLHRYDAHKTGITHHRDQRRFWGIIAVVTLEGKGILSIQDNDNQDSTIVKAGDLTLMRAPDLYPSDDDIRPMHGVDSYQGYSRTSLVIRADRQSDKQFDGFTYDNWP